jgi:hypothetical protein
VRTAGGRTCTCANGFIGTDCEIDVCLLNPCQNNGTCVRTAGGRTCTCAVGFFGPNCESCNPSNVDYKKYGIYFYRLSTNSVNWNTAKQTCVNEGARLVIIETLEKSNLTNSLVQIKVDYWVF